jgi:hypothetical protein
MLAHLLAPLNAVLFRLGNDEVTAAELLGFVTGAASVWLTVRARISWRALRDSDQAPAPVSVVRSGGA